MLSIPTALLVGAVLSAWMTSSLVIGSLSWSESGMTSILALGLGRRLDLLSLLSNALKQSIHLFSTTSLSEDMLPSSNCTWSGIWESLVFSEMPNLFISLQNCLTFFFCFSSNCNLFHLVYLRFLLLTALSKSCCALTNSCFKTLLDLFLNQALQAFLKLDRKTDNSLSYHLFLVLYMGKVCEHYTGKALNSAANL